MTEAVTANANVVMGTTMEFVMTALLIRGERERERRQRDGKDERSSVTDSRR
jgi:hypothetical protein